MLALSKLPGEVIATGWPAAIGIGKVRNARAQVNLIQQFARAGSAAGPAAISMRGRFAVSPAAPGQNAQFAQRAAGQVILAKAQSMSPILAAKTPFMSSPILAERSAALTKITGAQHPTAPVMAARSPLPGAMIARSFPNQLAPAVTAGTTNPLAVRAGASMTSRARYTDITPVSPVNSSTLLLAAKNAQSVELFARRGPSPQGAAALLQRKAWGCR